MGADRCDDFFIQQDRDYWLPTSGLDSGRPSGTNGQFYAATDARNVYFYTNGWTTVYAAAAYPHPLQNEAGGGATFVQAPAGVRVRGNR